MNRERSHCRSDVEPRYWRDVVARSWRHLVCWAVFGLGVFNQVWMLIDMGGISPEIRVQNPLILVLAGLAGVYGLDTRRLQRRIAELESRLEADRPQEDAAEESV